MDWDGTGVLDRVTKPIQLKVKLNLHIERIPANNRHNCNGGYNLYTRLLDHNHKEAGGVGPTAPALITLALGLWPLHQTGMEHRSHSYSTLAFLHLTSPLP